MTLPWESFHKGNLKFDKEVLIKDITSVFIYNKNNGDSITFNLVPDSIQENYSAKYVTESNIFGRIRPLHFYIGGEDKTISFSFTIHEDLLPKYSKGSNDIKKEFKNLYDLLENLKSFSIPLTTIINKKSLIKKPQVYLQIGKHFAGEGFIETSWSYELPYRDGRFLLANVSLNFTYNLEYETPKIDLISEAQGLIISQTEEDLFFDIGKEQLKYYKKTYNKDLTEFMNNYLNYDYVRTFAYQNVRLDKTGNFNTGKDGWYKGIVLSFKFGPNVEEALDSRLLNAEDHLFFNKVIGESELNEYIKEVKGPFNYLLYFYMLQLPIVLHPLLTDKVEDLIMLKRKVSYLKYQYQRVQGKSKIGIYGVNDWWNKPFEPTPEEQKEFMNLADNILAIIDANLIIINSQKGASQ